MIKNYKSTIAGAFSALGSTLMGVGIIPQLNGAPSALLTWIALAGFIINAIGSFLGHLFAADAKTLGELSTVVSEHDAAIRTGDSSILERSK